MSNIFAVGASRNIGYYAAVSLLKQGHTITFLLRRPDCFNDDADIKPFIDSGKAKIVKGDALVAEQVQNAWQTASAERPVDIVIFSVGGAPKFSVTKGFVTSPPDLCTASLMNVLSVIPREAPQPRCVVVTSHGITGESHKSLPLFVKGVHAFIKIPHADKLGMERAINYSGGWPAWQGEEPIEEVLAPGWQAKLGGQQGWLKSIMIVRPALLNDGAEKGKYRVGEQLPGLYSVSRRDVAHFIVNDAIPNWEKYEGKGVSVGY